MFRDGRGPDGDEPPNNWPSVFGGRGWTRVTEADGTPGQWYLHIFDATQPDLNWHHPEVREEFHDILRFWCDRGRRRLPRRRRARPRSRRDGLPDCHGPVGLYDEVDADRGPTGSGRDVDWLRSADGHVLDHTATGVAPMWDQDGVHEIYRGWRKVLDAYGAPDRILCAEAWVKPEPRLARYVRPDEMHQAFNFDFLDAHWDATAHQQRSSSRRCAPTTPSAPRRPGCCRTTTSCATPRGSASTRAGRAPTASPPTTRSRMPCSACAARARRPR